MYSYVEIKRELRKAAKKTDKNGKVEELIFSLE